MTQTTTQEQRLDFLIRCLLKEKEEYRDIEVPADKREKQRLLRSLMNVRPPVPASDEFLKNEAHVEAYLKAHKKAVEFIQENPEEAQKLVIEHLKDLTGKDLDKDEVAAAFDRLIVTTDINEKVIEEMATISKEANYIKDDNIDGLIELKYLQKLQ